MTDIERNASVQLDSWVTATVLADRTARYARLLAW